MTIIQLEYLLAVVNSGSFSAAAQACFVTQPSLSQQIKALEEELGTVLLDRTKKPVVPTETGKVVIELSREAVWAFGRVRESVDELRGKVAGTLRLGIDPTIAPYIIHRFVPDFMRAYPRVEIEIRELAAGAIVDGLVHDRLDAAVVAGGTCTDVAIEEELFDDRFCVYVSPSNPLFERSNVRIEDIGARMLLLPGAEHPMRAQVLEMFGGSCHNKLSPLLEGGSIESLMAVAEHTGRVVIVPEMVRSSLPGSLADRLKPLAKGAYSRKVVLAVRRTYVKLALIEALKEYLPGDSGIIRS